MVDLPKRSDVKTLFLSTSFKSYLKENAGYEMSGLMNIH